MTGRWSRQIRLAAPALPLAPPTTVLFVPGVQFALEFEVALSRTSFPLLECAVTSTRIDRCQCSYTSRPLSTETAIDPVGAEMSEGQV